MNRCTMKLAAISSKGFDSKLLRTEAVRVYFRVKVLSLQRYFFVFVNVLSFHRMHDKESEKMKNLLNKPIYCMK